MGAHVERAGAEGIDLPLHAGGGRAVRLRDVDIALTFDGTRVARLALELRVDLDTYQAIERDALFHLEPENRGRSFAPLAAGAPVEIELELASALVARLAAEGMNSAAVAAGMLFRLAANADEQEPILRAESWYATHVRQDRGGGMKTGFATRWAGASTLG